MIRRMYYKLRLNLDFVTTYFSCKINGFSAIPSGKKLLDVSPEQIELFYDVNNTKPPLFGIKDGKWDEQVYNFEERVQFKSFVEHFSHGVKWEDTELYKRDIQRIKSGKHISSLNRRNPTVQEYEEYLNTNDELYEEIKNEGYRTQSELASESRMLCRNQSFIDEVTVFIGRGGDLICRWGKHRLAIAKILDLQTIPVRVGVRHEQWQMIREKVASAEKYSDLNNQVATHIGHPDLRDVISPEWNIPPHKLRVHSQKTL